MIEFVFGSTLCGSLGRIDGLNDSRRGSLFMADWTSKLQFLYGKHQALTVQ